MKFSKLSDDALVTLAQQVGKEVDRRWYGCNGRKIDRFLNASDVFAHFHLRLSRKRQEHLILMILDQRHRLIGERIVTLGTLNASLIHAREVFAPAIEARACAIILIHNHPSGDATPSQQDLTVMRRLKKVGELIEIAVLDHVIIGRHQYYSDNLQKIVYV